MAAFDCLQEAIYIVAANTAVVVGCNLSACRELKKSRNEIVGQSLYVYREDDFDAGHWQAVRQRIADEGLLVQNSWYLRENGHAYPTEEIIKNIDWQGAQALLFSVRDITPRAAASTSLGNREPLLSFVLNEATDGMWEWDVARDDVFYSMPLKRMLGYGPYEIDHNLFSWQNSIHPDDSPRVMSELEHYMNGDRDRYDLEYRLGKRGGGYVWIHDRGHVTARDTTGKARHIVGMVRNIHAQKVMEEQLIRMATRDELTGLLNRRSGYIAFEQQLQLANREQHPLSIALFDLDAFKMINDTYGHPVGDRALSMAAGMMTSRIRRSDILMRWGGEEFLLVMPHTDGEGARALAEAVRETLQQAPFKNGAERIQLTLSAGIASTGEHGTTTSQLVHAADKALYLAKGKGRNRVEG
tara:strand:- start:1558 stop:2796 length:1239 start_codon:yes stop_codon:yes gene_type:complete